MPGPQLRRGRAARLENAAPTSPVGAVRHLGLPDAAAVPPSAELTEAGLPLPDADGAAVLVIACGALAREIVALKRLNGWDRLALTCLPAILHNHPDRIVPALRERIAQARSRGYERIVIGYADCGTGGGIDRLCAEEGLQRIAGPHCYSFFDGNDAFAEREDEIGAFYLTDFLARQFETLIWKGMGLDRHPDLVAMMFGNYDRLIYLAQTEDAALERKAEAAAERLGLAYERRMVGYGDLAGFLRSSTTPG